MLKKLLAVGLLLFGSLAMKAQTSHVFCPTDANCIWAGNQTYNGTVTFNGTVLGLSAAVTPGFFTVATLPVASSHSGLLAYVTDASTTSNCTTGGGSNIVLCSAQAGVWTPLGSSNNSININNSPVSNPNFGATPAAGTGFSPVVFSVSGSNVSGKVAASITVTCGGTDDTAAIQAALGTGNVNVRLYAPGGVCQMGPTSGGLTIHSNTVLDLGGANLSYNPTTATVMLTNAASAEVPNRTITGCVATSGSTSLTCSGGAFTTADYLQSSDCLTAAGAGNNYDLHTSIVNITSSTVITLADPPGQTVNPATCKIIYRDTNLTVQNGVMTLGGSLAALSSQPMIYIKTANNITFQNLVMNEPGTAGAFHINVADATNVLEQNLTFFSTQLQQDGIDNIGPIRDVFARNIFCNTGDDCVDIATSFASSPVVGLNDQTIYGTVDGVEYGGVYGSSTSANDAVKILLSIPGNVFNVHAHDIVGGPYIYNAPTINSFAGFGRGVDILIDPVGLTGTAGKISNITADHISGVMESAPVFIRNLGGISGAIGDVYASNLANSAPVSAGEALVQVAISPLIMTNLTLDMPLTALPSSELFLSVGSGSIITNLFTNNTTPALYSLAGTITNTYTTPKIVGAIINGHCFTASGTGGNMVDSGAGCASGGISALTGDVTATGSGSVVATVVNPYPLVDIQKYFPTAINVGAMMAACLADATVLPGWTCDATRAVQNDSAVGTAWSISAGSITITMQNNVPVGGQVHIVFNTTTALTADYTITGRTATTVTAATGSGLVSGTETVTMYPLKNTPVEIGRSQQQIVKWPSGGVLYDQTPATTLATPGAPGVVPTTGTGSLPAGTYLVDVWYRTGDAVSLPSTETSVTLSSTGEITITGPATCPTYAQGWDFGITAAGGGTGTETLQGNAICGGTAVFKNVVLFPSQPSPPSAATGVPAFILWNINNPAMYASTGIARFTIRTGPAFGASNIIATGTKGFSALNNISAYNFSHINMTGCSIFDSAFFAGSSRQGVGAVGTGGTSGNPSCAYKIYGTANDVKFDSLGLNVQDTFGIGLVIQRTPSTYNDGEGGGRLEFDRLTVVGTTSTLPLVTLAGIPCGAATNVNCFGLADILFTTPSFETQAATSCMTMTDVAGITLKNPTCASTTFTGSNPAYIFTSTAGVAAQYQANTLDIENPATVGYPVIYNNGINGDTVTVPNNNFPYTGAYHYGGGKLPTDVWQSRPVTSDSTIVLSAINALTLSAMTGTSCLEEISGVITAFGSACGGGAVSSVSNSDSTLIISPTAGAVVASLNLAHANTWTAAQTMPSLITGSGSVACGTATACIAFAEAATAGAPTASNDYFRADITHLFKMSLSSGAEFTSLMNYRTINLASTTDDGVTGILAPANEGTGTAAAGSYVDGAAGAWTALPFKSLTTTGSSGAATLASGVLNIPIYSGGASFPTSTAIGQTLFYPSSGSTSPVVTSAIGADSTGTQAQTENILVTAQGPSTYTTLTSALTTGATTAVVASTASYATFGYYWVVNTGFTNGDVVSATVLNSTTFTLNSRGLCNETTPGTNIPIGSKIVPISMLVVNTITAQCPLAVLQNSAILLCPTTVEWNNGSAFGSGTMLSHCSETHNGNVTLGGTLSSTSSITGGTLNVVAARKGTFVCTGAGTITITNANELVTSDVFISLNTAGGTITTPPAMKTVTSGTGFTVLCGATDTSTYNYDIPN